MLGGPTRSMGMSSDSREYRTGSLDAYPNPRGRTKRWPARSFIECAAGDTYKASEKPITREALALGQDHGKDEVEKNAGAHSEPMNRR